MMIYRPMYADKIMMYADTPFLKILTGVKGSGKSTILKMIMKKLQNEKGISEEQIVSYCFDSTEFEDMTFKHMYQELSAKIYKNGRTYLFLDEVQKIKNWEKVLNLLSLDNDIDIYIAGSDSKIMSSEILTYFTGKNVTFHIYTLSFGEYLTFKREYAPLEDDKTEFNIYIKSGGFPAVHLSDDSQNEAHMIVREIYNAIVYSDIAKYNRVRKLEQLENVIRYVFDNVGNKLSAKAISDYLKDNHCSLDNETANSYLDKLEKVYLLHRCSRYDLQEKGMLKTQEKFYQADMSLRYAILGDTAGSVASTLENIVYLELCRRGYMVYIGKAGGGEIDFVATRRNKKIYVQVAKTINSEVMAGKEYELLLAIKDNYPKYVLRMDEFDEVNYKGIKTMYVAEFLLSSEF